MNTALRLSNSHRFITRSAARFFLHIGDVDHAKYVLAHNPLTKYDPWLLASEIAISCLEGKTSRLIKCGIEMVKSDRYNDFSLSELSSAIGTVEAANGKRKECRKLINKALLMPNDNSVSQAEWLSTEYHNLGISFSDYNSLKNNYEPNARRYSAEKKYNDAILYGLDWCIDMPFTKRPIVFSSHIAYTFLKDYESAISILKFGLETHNKDYDLINNLAYAYAMNNQIQEAKELLESIPADAFYSMRHDFAACLLATLGLTYYRCGDSGNGSLFYQKSLELIKKQRLGPLMESKAKLNFLREKVRASDTINGTVMSQVDGVPDYELDELKQLKSDIHSIIVEKQEA